MYKLNDTKILKNIIDILSDVMLNTCLLFKEDALYISAMDDSHISLIKAKIEYNCTSYEKDKNIGISLVDLSKVLKNSSGPLTIKLSDSKMLLIFENADYELDQLLDLTNEEGSIDNYVADFSILLESKKFKSHIDSLKTFGDVICFETINSKLFGKSVGSKVKQKIVISNDVDVNISGTNFASSILSTYSKATVFDIVKISFSMDRPMYLNYYNIEDAEETTVEDIESKRNYFCIYICPKIN